MKKTKSNFRQLRKQKHSGQVKLSIKHTQKKNGELEDNFKKLPQAIDTSKTKNMKERLGEMESKIAMTKK